MDILYTAKAQSTGGGRQGHVETDDKLISLDLAYPKELGGNGGASNPEQLFAAGYSACFANAILHVAQNQKIEIKDVPVAAEVGIGANAQGGFALKVELQVTLDLPQQEAEKLVNAAHQVCPYSNALRGNVDVTLVVSGK
jgi:osmotically inducible protein OsmC